ncbi:MAG: hypothetical protein KC994_26330, partial [Candidatus Omnitrophica bacterium]|nr:hypothetical protein [Candidatus Omnitrophota bacterium]
MSQLPATVVGFYQVLFQPVEWNHNWHANIDFLRDFENRLKTESDPLSDQKYRIPPSADQRQEAFEVEKKAHNDKPIFACAVRLGLLAHDSKSKFFLPLLDSSLNVFQHGGSPFNRLIDVDYFKVLPFGHVRMMFENGLVFRPGFLVNTEELVGFAHVPPPVLFKRDDLRWSPLERLIPSQELFEDGSPLGRMLVAEDVKTVHARLQEKFESIHIMGSPGVGKSTLMSSMILDDIKKGHGVAIIDPHGTVVTQVLQRLPDDCEDRVVFLSWADMDWVPLWNPLLVSDSRRSGRVVEELIAAFQSIMGASWGNRLEHLLRMSIRALCEIGSTSFLDLYSLLDSGPKNVNLIRRRIQQEYRT